MYYRFGCLIDEADNAYEFNIYSICQFQSLLVNEIHLMNLSCQVVNV